MPDLSDNVNWSEVDANNNQAPPNGWPEGMMPSGVNDAARADRGALKRYWNKVNAVQPITSSGGIYTFTTGNAAYPTGYVTGEMYCFRAQNSSVGGDQFQVNALGPKPIWKLATPEVISPISAFDICGGPVQLVYNANLNAGVGAFILLNPFAPIANDGTGLGVVTPGGLTVNQDGGTVRPTLQNTIHTIGAPNTVAAWLNDTYGTGAAGVVTIRHANGSNTAPSPLVSGNVIGAYSFRGWDSTGAADFTPASARIFATATEAWNTGAHGTQLEIDTCNNGSTTLSSQLVIGPGLTVGTPTAPSGGMLIGDINAQRLFSNGQAVAVTAADGSATVTGNASIGGTLGVTGATTLGGNASVGGTLNVTGTTTLTGAVTSPSQIQAENLRSVGDSYIGNSLFVEGGAGNITAAGIVQGENLQSVGDSYIGGNLYVTGLINGHPAAVFDSMTAQLQMLTSRVMTLEAELQTLRTQAGL